jgi:ABC-2 type transport system ATP-binding protein
MLLHVQAVTKEYRGGTRANDGITLSVGAGEVFGLLGHNGAGKTTLISQIVGLARPTTGRIAIDDHDVVADPGFARRSCSLQPQAQVPIVGLTARTAVELMGRLRGGDRRLVGARTAELAAALDITGWLDTRAERLSGGVLRLVAFCMAAVVPGRIVILDEPTNDVDPLRRRLLWRQVRELGDRGSAVLLVTHNVLEAERAVDRLAILDRGRIVAEGTPASLRAAHGGGLRMELAVEPGVRFESPGFLLSPVWAGGRLTAGLRDERLAEAVGWANAQKRSGLVEEFSIGPVTLEDVYVRLAGERTGGGVGDGTGDAAVEPAGRIVNREDLDALAA